MLKRSTKHTFYEVWSESASESVFVDVKPTKADVDFLWKENWPCTSHRPEVFKLKHFYAADKCRKCSGNGCYSTSSEPRVKCNDCKGTGRL